MTHDSTSDASIEQEIQQKGLNAPRVTKATIDELMGRVTYSSQSRHAGTTSTFVHAYLDGRFYLASGHSACVDPANFDHELGFRMAKAKAEAAARDKLWELEGYRLFRSGVVMQGTIDHLVKIGDPHVAQMQRDAGRQDTPLSYGSTPVHADPSFPSASADTNEA